MSDKRLTVDDLSPDQREVYEAIIGWLGMNSGVGCYGGDPKLLTTGGLAGTGKTTLLGVLAANVDMLVAYVTFTGRASSILARKLKAAGARTTDKMMPPEGMRVRGRALDLYDPNLEADSGPAFVGTIHRLLYSPVVDSTTEELVGWRKREKLDRKYDLIVIDEASMVGASMLFDLKVHGVPILAVGDHGQLPPVMDAGDLMKNPDLRLEKIHRQAESSSIIRLAHHIRNTGRLWAMGPHGDGAVRFMKKADVFRVLESIYEDPNICGANNPDGPDPEFPPRLLDVGILCWTNRSRVALNATARKALGFSGPPKKGEVVIALKNKPPVYNGMRGVLTRDSSPEPEGSHAPWLVGLFVEFPDEGLTAEDYLACAPQFCREKKFASVEELRERGINVRTMGDGGYPFDFGYCLTIHRSQGSQFEHAIFYVDHPVRPDDPMWRALAYTAVSRAASRLTVLL